MNPIRLTSAIAALALLAGCATQERAADTTDTQADAAQAEAVSLMSPGSMRLWVDGLGCPMCATNVDLALSDLDGVESTSINLETGEVTVTVDPDRRPSDADVVNAVRSTGFTVRSGESR